MGDRTWASITIHQDDYPKVIESPTEEKYFISRHCLCEIDKDSEPYMVQFIDDQANYGKIESLEDLLQELEIEYTLRWEDGGDYSAGEEHLRWIDGVYTDHAIYDDQAGTLITLKNIAKEYDPKNPEAMLLAINNKIKEYEPWEVKPPASRLNAKRFIKED